MERSRKQPETCIDILLRFWKLYVCFGITAAIASLILLIVGFGVGFNTVSTLTSPTSMNHLVSNIMTNQEMKNEFQTLFLNSLENENLQNMLVELVSKAFTRGIFPKIDLTGTHNNGFLKKVDTSSNNMNFICPWNCEEIKPVCSNTCQMCSLFKDCIQTQNQTNCFNYAMQMINFCSN